MLSLDRLLDGNISCQLSCVLSKREQINSDTVLFLDYASDLVKYPIYPYSSQSTASI